MVDHKGHPYARLIFGLRFALFSDKHNKTFTRHRKLYGHGSDITFGAV